MTVTRRTFLIAFAAGAVSGAAAEAAQRMPYEAKAFQSALAAGRSILVHVTAVWCAECQQQRPIVARLADQPDFKDLTIFDVDFDTQKGALREMHVQKQSTLLAFKGKNEVARLVGDTRATSIEAVMKKTL